MRERVKIRFRLLGPRLTDRFVVSVARRAPRPFKISPQKGRALLAYLAMQPEHFARREDLANLLWGDQVDEYARHNLRQCLAILRDEFASIAPDFLIVDIRGDASSAMAGIERLRAAAPSAGIFAIAVTADPDLILQAMRAGANEFFIWPPSDETLRPENRWPGC